MFAQQSQQNEIIRPGIHLGAQKKRKVMTIPINTTCTGKVIFQKVASGYLLHFVQNGSSKSMLKQILLHNNLNK